MDDTSTQTLTFQLRRGTADEWTAKDPVLSDGEPGVETDTGRLRVGDGVSAWTDLPYFLREDHIATDVGDRATQIGARLRDSYAPLESGTTLDDSVLPNSAIAGSGDYWVSAAKFGVVEDDGTDATAAANTAAMQSFINYLCPSSGMGRHGIVPFRKVRVNATLNVPKSRGWGLRGMGIDRTVIEQATDNIPIFTLGVGGEGSGSTGFLHNVFGDFTLTYTNTQPATNTSANPVNIVGHIYNWTWLPIYFQKGYYGFSLAQGQVAPWGCTWDYLHFGPSMTGGAFAWSGAVNAIPGNDMRHIFIEADNMVGPLFSWRGYNWTINSIEVINAQQGPALMNFAAGSECVIGSLKVEGGAWAPTASQFSLITVASGSYLKIGTFSMQSSNGGLTMNPKSYLYVFQLGAGGTAGGQLEIGKARLDASSLKSSSCFVFGGGEGANLTSRARVGDLQLVNAGYGLTPVAAGSFMCNGVTVESWRSQAISPNLGDGDYTVGTFGQTYGTFVFQTALTASRTVALPAVASALIGGQRYRILSSGAVNGSNVLTVKSGTTTVATLDSDHEYVDVAWQRNASAPAGWLVVARGATV